MATVLDGLDPTSNERLLRDLGSMKDNLRARHRPQRDPTTRRQRLNVHE